jgi:hypothetical protein
MPRRFLIIAWSCIALSACAAGANHGTDDDTWISDADRTVQGEPARNTTGVPRSRTYFAATAGHSVPGRIVAADPGFVVGTPHYKGALLFHRVIRGNDACQGTGECAGPNDGVMLRLELADANDTVGVRVISRGSHDAETPIVGGAAAATLLSYTVPMTQLRELAAVGKPPGVEVALGRIDASGALIVEATYVMPESLYVERKPRTPTP